MRELYATELLGDRHSSNGAAWPAIRAWADRHVPLEQSDGARPLVTGGDTPNIDVSVSEEEASDGQRSLVLVQRDDGDSGLLWRSEVAVGHPASTLHATIRVRIGSTEGSALRPLDYEFGTPAIVRTLLNDFKIYDAGMRTEPRYIEIGASNIPELVSWIMNFGRRLPVVVVSRTTASGSPLLDAGCQCEVSGHA
jgi:hypothetical protein